METNELRILVIDDNAESLQIIRDTLEANGYIVETATDGEIGINKIRFSIKQGNPYTLTITDVMLPKVSGIDLLKRAREIAPQSGIIVISAFDEVDPFIKKEAITHGAFAFIPKPIEPAHLLAQIREYLSTKKIHHKAPGAESSEQAPFFGTSAGSHRKTTGMGHTQTPPPQMAVEEEMTVLHNTPAPPPPPDEGEHITRPVPDAEYFEDINNADQLPQEGDLPYTVTKCPMCSQLIKIASDVMSAKIWCSNCGILFDKVDVDVHREAEAMQQQGYGTNTPPPADTGMGMAPAPPDTDAAYPVQQTPAPVPQEPLAQPEAMTQAESSSPPPITARHPVDITPDGSGFDADINNVPLMGGRDPFAAAPPAAPAPQPAPEAVPQPAPQPAPQAGQTANDPLADPYAGQPIETGEGDPLADPYAGHTIEQAPFAGQAQPPVEPAQAAPAPAEAPAAQPEAQAPVMDDVAAAEFEAMFGDEQPAQAQPEPAVQAAPAEMRILLVEDDQHAAEILQTALDVAGFPSEIVVNGTDAYNAIMGNVQSASPYTLVISDVMLPGVNGLDLMKQVRSQIPYLDFILVSAYEDENLSLKRQAEAEGALTFFSKPYDYKDMVRFISSYRDNRG